MLILPLTASSTKDVLTFLFLAHPRNYGPHPAAAASWENLRLPICVRLLGMIRPIHVFAALLVLWLCNEWERTNISDRYNGDWSLSAWYTILHLWNFHLSSMCTQCNLFSKSWVGVWTSAPTITMAIFLCCFMRMSLMFWEQFDQEFQQYSNRGKISSKAYYDAMVEFDQIWFIFQHIVSPVVHTLLPSVLQRVDYHGVEALILILKKVLNYRYDLITSPILLSSQVFFHVGE